MRKSIGILLATLGIATLLTPAAHAELNVPTTAFPVCTDSSTLYCIESVSLTELSGKRIGLTWTASGSTTGALGSWSDPSWGPGNISAHGYDGLFVSARAANQYVSHIFVDVQPVIGIGASVKIATQPNNPKYPVDLANDTNISMTIRTGTIKVGATIGVGLDETVKTTYGAAYSTVQISGEPVPVAIAANNKDCNGQSGVAVANVDQFQAVILVENDTYGFGVPSASGNMVVSSNGSCNLSTPVWDPTVKQLKWGTSAPYFQSDGKSPNLGFYSATIPFADLTAYWGLKNPQDAATALTVSITTSASGSKAAIAKVSARNNLVVISASGFDFAAPILTIGINASYKPVAQKTISCLKGKITKSVSGANPSCPKGYSKKP